MIGYVTVGTNDMARSVAFYGPIFDVLGADLCFQEDAVASWGDMENHQSPRFFTCLPYDGKPAAGGNGTMTSFLVSTPEDIDEIYRLALLNGGKCEGAPGFRPEYGKTFYAAYMRDPDGNKLAFVRY
jgi:catechol 2,3-dioxygenase-like lactoylglutathione lyase family enzyme